MRRDRRHGLGALRSCRPPDSRHVEARSSITRRVRSAADDAARIAGSLDGVAARQSRMKAGNESSGQTRSFACLLESGGEDRGAIGRTRDGEKHSATKGNYCTEAEGATQGKWIDTKRRRYWRSGLVVRSKSSWHEPTKAD